MKKQKPVEETAQLKEVKEELEKYKSAYLRALADYQNLEKRTAQVHNEVKKKTVHAMIGRFLDVIDDIEKAEIFVQDDGLKMIKNKLLSILQEVGVTEIELKGKEFDPHFAEAIDVVEGEEDDIIIDVLRKGYVLNGEMLRPAQVRVSKKITH
ncbi:nucleotide exchange factor GrpE [Candidatus Roizmanbacteria bacterium RIFCSPHIGHO2_02_FULL_40_9]|uniref:Protein GrpE n=2 Tax=Candidatus Roizmaniibacteriota TaxID=1752723 RepID=A0A1F7IK07_9BACT|nr:MAG: nucleotide exchange factor GrpE [Candidatus Roizmanbacteria bacterium RIFCSPHIGHO2_02_FULL_40_9]OGK43686.1 MAG: nucleotide exchange factor GrpE [Candidatus Roizmanbacteria bacterium RIFCSPLOWO2_01_FULL_38_11]